MKGIIKTVHHFPSNVGENGGGVQYIFIVGDDGQEYFGHRNSFNRKAKHYKANRAVTFDVEDEGRAHPSAVNIDVEVPVNLKQPEDELVSIKHLQDGAYVKRIRKATGKEVCLIIKNGELVISCLPEYERNMIWMYQRGPSGEA